MNHLLPKVQAFAEGLELSSIPESRRAILEELSSYLQAKLIGKESININFICTHNSRRSQLCQVWAQTALHYYSIEGLQVFSGGTETTAFHPNAVKALESVGFEIATNGESENPTYSVRFSEEADPLECYSKVYYDQTIDGPFVAVLNCSDAEARCPFIPEAVARFSLKYEDPKKSDGTPFELQTYGERSRQIATEMFYIFSKIKN